MTARALRAPLVLLVLLGVPLWMALGTRQDRPVLVPTTTTVATPGVEPVIVTAPAVDGAPAGPAISGAEGRAGVQSVLRDLVDQGVTRRRVRPAGPTGAQEVEAALPPDIALVAPEASSSGPRTVSVLITADVVAAAMADADGTCWLVVDRAGTGRRYGRGGPCTAANAVLAAAPAW